MSSAEENSWRARPRLALALRIALIIIPLVVVCLAAWRIHIALGPPPTFTQSVLRWIMLSLGCTLAIRVLDSWAKRLLPMAYLLRMTVIFPDDVPSRYRVAMRQGTTRQLARDIDAGRLNAKTPQEAAEHLLGLVATLSSHDRATRGHTERTRAYTDLLAEQLGLSSAERAKLHWGGLLHDIGKLAIPAEVLNKTEPLTEAEWQLIRNHPNEGYKLIAPLKDWLGEWADGTRDHHERWDGAGYPRGLSGNNISRAGRIVAVADAFDVMTSKRSYNQPRTFDEARMELAAASGSHFDPTAVRAFLNLALTQRATRWSFFAWIANSPFITSVSGAPAAVVAGVAVASLATGGVPLPSADPTPVEIAVEEEETNTLELPDETTTTTTTTTVAPEETTTTAPTSTTTTTTTTTTTVAPTTTAPPTTAPPLPFPSPILGGGAGGEFELVDSLPGTLADLDNDGDPGLTLSPTPNGLIEIDDPDVVLWRLTATSDVEINGAASLKLFAATKDFVDGVGVILAGVVQCDQPTSGCTELGSGQAGFAQTGFGSDFGEVTVQFGGINHVVPAGKHLLITMAASTSSSHNLWIALGTADYPSAFEIR